MNNSRNKIEINVDKINYTNKVWEMNTQLYDRIPTNTVLTTAYLFFILTLEKSCQHYFKSDTDR